MSVADVQALLVPETLTRPMRLGGMNTASGRDKPARHRVVIVGGGAGGLELATRLGDRLGRRIDVTLIDRERVHVWKPKLHEIAAGSMDLSAHEVDYLAQAHWHRFRYRIGAMTGLDRARREVHVAASHDEAGREVTPQRAFGYDTLVIAVGSQSNDFGTPGVCEHAMMLESPADARRFHACMVNACIRAHAQTTPLRPEQLKVAIIGAGATGVELAAELHRTTREMVAYGLDRVDADKDLQVSVIEAADRVLPALPPRLSRATETLLAKLGVQVHTGARVAEVLRDGVRLADGRVLPAELVVWAAGVKAPDFLNGPRRAGDQSHQPARRAADAADDARRRRVRDRRLRGLPVARPRHRAAARTGRAPAGDAPVRADPKAAGRQAAAGLYLPRFRLAGVARRIQHGRQHDGRPRRRQPAGRRCVRAPDVPVAVQDARARAARPGEGDAGHAGAADHAAHRAAREAALTCSAPSPWHHRYPRGHLSTAHRA